MGSLPLLALFFVAVSPDASGDARLSRALIQCAPPTYEAALNCLDKLLPAEDQAKLAEPGGTIDAHLGLGMWIRNNWGLWRQGPLYRSMHQAFGLSHPDDMSGAILDGFAAKERGESYNVVAEAAKNQAEGKKLWDEAVKEGRAGSYACPKDPVRDSNAAKKPTEDEIGAALEKCFDHIAKQLDKQIEGKPQ